MNTVTVVDGEEKREKIGVGSLWQDVDANSGCGDCMLVEAGKKGGSGKLVHMVYLKHGQTHINYGVLVANSSDITKEEWEDICEGVTFTRVYHIEIKQEGR